MQRFRFARPIPSRKMGHHWDKISFQYFNTNTLMSLLSLLSYNKYIYKYKEDKTSLCFSVLYTCIFLGTWDSGTNVILFNYIISIDVGQSTGRTGQEAVQDAT